MKLYQAIFTFILSLSLFACSSTPKTEYKDLSLNQIIKLPQRAEDSVRDKYRHPVQTLEFFDIKPNHTVVEINPSAGWYTKILGPYLKDEGKLYLSIFNKNNTKSYAKRYNKKIKEVVKDSSLYGDIEFTELDASFEIRDIAPENSVDRVVTFRNTHGWIRSGKDKEIFKAFYKALKPGGILGLVQHRLPKTMKQDKKASTGYVQEAYIINMAKAAGFKLIAKSEINANPKDSHDHKNGVWSLPPSLRIDDNLKAKYSKIGESDRMTLKFKKP